MTTPDTTESQISEQDTTRHFFALLSRFILTLKKDAPGESSLKLHSHLFFILFTLNQADQGMLTLGDLARELDISKQQLTKLSMTWRSAAWPHVCAAKRTTANITCRSQKTEDRHSPEWSAA